MINWLVVSALNLFVLCFVCMRVLIDSVLKPVAVVSGVGALQVNIPKDLYEYARGDNITLPCSFQSKITDPKLVIVTWSVQDKEDSLAPEVSCVYHNQNKPNQSVF